MTGRGVATRSGPTCGGCETRIHRDDLWRCGHCRADLRRVGIIPPDSIARRLRDSFCWLRLRLSRDDTHCCRCPSCQYRVAMLDSHHCPECGADVYVTGVYAPQLATSLLVMLPASFLLWCLIWLMITQLLYTALPREAIVALDIRLTDHGGRYNLSAPPGAGNLLRVHGRTRSLHWPIVGQVEPLPHFWIEPGPKLRGLDPSARPIEFDRDPRRQHYSAPGITIPANGQFDDSTKAHLTRLIQQRLKAWDDSASLWSRRECAEILTDQIAHGLQVLDQNFRTMGRQQGATWGTGSRGSATTAIPGQCSIHHRRLVRDDNFMAAVGIGGCLLVPALFYGYSRRRGLVPPWRPPVERDEHESTSP